MRAVELPVEVRVLVLGLTLDSVGVSEPLSSSPDSDSEGGDTALTADPRDVGRAECGLVTPEAVRDLLPRDEVRVRVRDELVSEGISLICDG